MVQKRGFHDQHDGGFGTPSREPKRIHTFKTASTFRGHILHSILEPFIRKVVREETECAMSKLFHSSSSSSVKKSEPSGGCGLQLLFVNQLPGRIFTNNTLKAEDGSPLKVVLYDANSKTEVKSGPLSAAKIDIVVLSGLFATDQEDWTEEEFNAKTLCEREGKRPLLAGNQSIVLTNGVGLISDVSITDNSSWIPNKKFILGAKISWKNSEKPRVREARSHPFSVKDNRGEVYTKHYPPSLQDEVWRLEKIRKDGKLHGRLTSHGISTVQDFLLWNETNQSKLRQILGCGRMSEKMWCKIVDHAKTCIMDDFTILKYPNGCYGALVEDLNQPAYVNRYDEQPVAKLSLTHQQADPFIPPNGPNQGFEPLEPAIIYPQEHLQIQGPIMNTNSNEEDGTHSIFQMQNSHTNEAFTPALGTSYVIEDCTFLYQTPCYFPPPATSEQGNDLLPSSSYAAEAADRGIFPSYLDHGVNILNRVD